MEKLEGRIECKVSKTEAPSRRTNGGFVNDVLFSWEEMKTEHIRNKSSGGFASSAPATCMNVKIMDVLYSYDDRVSYLHLEFPQPNFFAKGRKSERGSFWFE